MRVMRMGRAGTRGGEGAGPLESAAVRWGKTMVSTGRIGNRGDVHGVRGQTLDAGGETGAPAGVAASGQGTVRRAGARASGAACEGSRGTRALGGALLRRLSSLGRPASCRGPRLRALRLALAFSLALAGLAALASATPAQAQTTFVSNIGQADESGQLITETAAVAQQFTTGTDGRGYELTEVVVNISVNLEATPDFDLYTSDSDDRPGTKIADLNGSMTAAGEQSFTPAKTVIPPPVHQVFHPVRKGCGSSHRNARSLGNGIEQ